MKIQIMDKNKEKCSEDKTINKEHSGDEGDNWLHLESSRDEESINDDKTDKENTSAVISSGDFYRFVVRIYRNV